MDALNKIETKKPRIQLKHKMPKKEKPFLDLKNLRHCNFAKIVETGCFAN